MAKPPSEPRDLPRALGRRLRQLRDARQLTQGELAELAHLDTSYISQIENGHRDPSLTSLGALADALGMSLAEFLAVDEPTVPADAAVRDAINAELRRLRPDQTRIVLDLVRLFARAMRLPADVESDDPRDPQ